MGSTQSTNEISQSEGPLVESFTLESMQHSRLYLGAEHLRSLNLSPMSTAISFTGVFMRYYLNAAPVPYLTGDDLRPNEITIHDLCYFIGVGVGLGQSNMLPDASDQSSNAAGVYASPRAGLEMSLGARVGVRGELMMATTVFGKGNLTSMSLLGSVYYEF